MNPTLASSRLLERCAHLRADGSELSRLHGSEPARFLILVDGRPAILSNEDRTRAAIRWFSRSDLTALDLNPADALFLGTTHDGDAARFAISLTETDLARIGEKLKPVVDLMSLAMQGVMPPDELSLIGLAKALAGWHGTHRYCGRCGSPTELGDGGWKRTCARCRHHYFPRVDPVVIMLVTDGPRCVLAREQRFPERMYSLLAGFVEPGEDIEHAVARETLEEIGLAVRTIRYELSQPWPFPHSLMIGCVAVVEPGDLRPDRSEIEDARWFDRAELQLMLKGAHPDGLWVPGAQAIANAVICRWLEAPPVST